MFRIVFILVLSNVSLLLPTVLRASDAASSTFYPRTLQSTAGHTATVRPDQEPVTVTQLRSWSLDYADHATATLADARLRLPRQGIEHTLKPERLDTGWRLGDLPMDHVGVWLLDLTFDTVSGTDRIRFKLAVDEKPFVVATRPTPGQVALIKAMALPLTSAPEQTEAALERAKLGQALFFDPRLSASRAESCASCHVPNLAFTDAKARSRPGSRNAPSLIGIAGKRWFNRDGSKDSLWSQALGPIEHPDELGLDRVTLLQRIAAVPEYRAGYARAFDDQLDAAWLATLPAASPTGDADTAHAWSGLTPTDHATINRHFANVGHLLAAYQTQLTDQPSAFDRFAHALDTAEADAQHLSADAQRGLMLFIGSRTQCLDCHSGPRMTNGRFHNIGTAPRHGQHADPGRKGGIENVLSDPFNCNSTPGNSPAACDHLGSVWRVEIPYLLDGAFLTPGLRNVAKTGPWFHDGSAETLDAVMEHYRSPPPSQSGRTEHELSALALSDEELSQIVAFLESLTGDPIDAHWLSPPARAD